MCHCALLLSCFNICLNVKKKKRFDIQHVFESSHKTEKGGTKKNIICFDHSIKQSLIDSF